MENKENNIKDKKKRPKSSEIEMNPTLNEQIGFETVVLTFGRFNPPTIGHEHLVNKMKSLAGAYPMRIYLSHSTDSNKNPITYSDKFMLARRAFGNSVVRSKARNIIQVMKELDSIYKNVIVVVGEDRVQEFEKLLNKYNGVEYSLDNISVVSAGTRDPDSKGVQGISGTKARECAIKGDVEGFIKCLPKKLKSSGEYVYSLVRAGLSLTETIDLKQRRKRSITMRRYKTKIAQGRRKALRRPASRDKLKNRAQRSARSAIKSRFSSGKKYSDMSVSQKIAIDKRVKNKSSIISRMAKRLLPKMRKRDKVRRSGGRINEIATIRFHKVTNPDGTMKYDKRFRAFRGLRHPNKENENKSKE